MFLVYNVLWCDSVQGKISYRVDSDGEPVSYTRKEVSLIERTHDLSQAFYILGQRDGTLVAIHNALFKELMGWL